MHSVKSNILYGFNRKMYLTHRDASSNRIEDMIFVIESGDQWRFTPLHWTMETSHCHHGNISHTLNHGKLERNPGNRRQKEGRKTEKGNRKTEIEEREVKKETEIKGGEWKEREERERERKTGNEKEREKERDTIH